LFFPIIAYTLSSTKSEIRAKYFLPGSKGGRGREGGGGREEKEWGKGEEMTQTLYAHMNKRKYIYIMLILDQWFLTEAVLSFKNNLAKSGESFYCYSWKSATDIYWVRARDVC
jgi:hypothetical protein